MSRSLVVLATALAAVMPASASVRSTGLRGLVSRGPISPVCQAGTSCDTPSKHTTLTFTRNGVTKSAVTGTDGGYSVLLAAGAYAVRIPTAKFGFTPRSVTVVAGRMSIRNFSIDTGIR